MENQLPRGIAPRILVQHIRNTTPFVFEVNAKTNPFVTLVQSAEQNPEQPYLHESYFELCVAAHWTTVASFVPTDVDNQIRFRLWHPTLSPSQLFAMVGTVERARSWPIDGYTTRYIRTASGIEISGHSGEWFSIAAGAYGACRKKNPELANTVMTWIEAEVNHHATLFEELVATKDSIGFMKASALIAHNLGDLVRVMDMWELPENDPLRILVLELTKPGSTLDMAGELNKKMMAVENHRHFALRKPKGLRKNPELLLPLGPFFDSWGARIALHPELSPTELGSVVEALIDGWEFLEGVPVGYARALAGIEGAYKGGMVAVCDLLPAKMARQLRTGKLRALISVERERFESQWKVTATKFIAGYLEKTSRLDNRFHPKNRTSINPSQTASSLAP